MVDYLHLITITAHDFFLFLCVKDLVIFDSACVSRSARQSFIATLSRVNISDLTFTALSAEWMLRRNLLPTIVKLTKYVTDVDVCALLKVSTRVEEICLEGHQLSTEILCELIHHCPKLKIIHRRDMSLSGPKYIDILMKLGGIIEFTAPDQNLQPMEFQSVLESCTMLRNIDISRCMQLMSESAVENIAKFCPALRSLVLGHVNRMRDDELPHLAACTKLTSIHIAGADLSVIPGFAEFASRCPASLEVLQLSQVVCQGLDLVVLARRCSLLRELHLHCCEIDASAMHTFATVVAVCPALVLVSVQYCHWFDNDCLRAMVARPKLRSLCMHDLEDVINECVAGMLRFFPLLESLDLQSIRMNASQVLRSVGLHCPHLCTLKILCTELQQTDLTFMTARCTRLVDFELIVTYSHHTYQLDCTHLQSLQRVCLRSYYGVFTDASILHIVSHCPQLRVLSVCSDFRCTAPNKCVTRDTDIVRTMAQNCPHLRHFLVKHCSEKVHRELVRLQEARSLTKFHFQFNTEVVPSRLKRIANLLF